MVAQRTIPTDHDLLNISLSKATEYEVNERECRTIRSRIYSINKNNAAGRRYRTLYEFGILMVWRIA